MTTLKRLALKSLMFDYRFSLMPHVKYIEQTLAISQQFLLQTIGGDNISLSHFEFKWFTTVNLYIMSFINLKSCDTSLLAGCMLSAESLDTIQIRHFSSD